VQKTILDRALAEYEQTPRNREIRKHQEFMRTALARHKRPEGFEPVDLSLHASGAMKEIDSLRRVAPVEPGKIPTVRVVGVQRRGDLQVAFAAVAAEFELEIDTVKKYWKRYAKALRRLQRDSDFLN
jgi:hypothetical protein